jgi:aminomethyltransferase
MLSTAEIAGKHDFSASYTTWCLPAGGCVDDLIVYRYNQTSFFVIFNAGNRQKDLEHLKRYSVDYDVVITDRFNEDGILSVQGPFANNLLEITFPHASHLKPMHFIEMLFEGEKIVIATTGYTGAGGFEVFGSNGAIIKLWEIFLDEGKRFNIEPIGLAARDILRLEMGYALYGHEIDESIAPIESVCAWTVKMTKDYFLGKEALEKLSDSPSKRCEQGILLTDPGIAREGCAVFKDGREMGRITSGGYSPTLEKSIAIALLKSKLDINSDVEIAIRNKLCKAKIVDLPFIKKAIL